ncbi:MAG: type II toxin-antitoxin system VapC family toxin, partial [Pseudonocardiaceae bacterium]
MLLVDTNVWLAAADRRSDHHEVCTRLLHDRRGELAVPVPVIAETSWLILDRLGPAAHRDFFQLLVAGSLVAVDLDAGDWQRCVELIGRYADLRLDLMDASIVAIAERTATTTIATFNYRDFQV